MSCDRTNWDLLVRAVDQELSPAEQEWVPAHIAACADCRSEIQSVEALSNGIAGIANSAPVVENFSDRRELAALRLSRQAPDRVMKRFGWGMVLAASLAVGIMLAPKQRGGGTEQLPVHQSVSGAVNNAIEVDGETFVALPYSNPDLPSSSPRIVQMQVPVSSLADIGIGTAIASNENYNQDRTVLADVLLGADGQPLGVHVVSWE